VAGGHAAGGSAGLAGLIEQHGEFVFADLHRVYGLNLVSALQPGSGYSPRQILILIRNLPVESATMAALRGGSEYLGWGMDRYLTTSLIDAVNFNTYAVVAAAGPKRKPKAPEPMYRPEKAKKTKKVNMFSVMAGQRLAVARRARQARGATK
jgi:hypothetical protein